jgi:arylsulfatase A
MNSIKQLILAMVALVPLALLQAADAPASKPNVVLILADDLGYGDLGCYGNTRIPTPRIDQMAGEGMLFRQAYTAASVCTPARYALLTGRYPWRTWLKKDVVGNTPALIDPDTFTMADLFKTAGYRTAAIGKWHIGLGDRGQKDLDWNAEIPKGPCEIGFDYFFGMPVSHFFPPHIYIENRRVHNLDPADPLSLEWPQGRGRPTQHGGKSATYKQEEAGPELAARACRWIEENRRNPFFLYYAAIEPHDPFTPHRDFIGKSKVGLYGDFIAQFDHGVGRILDTLEKLGLADHTIVILTSDNGGVSRQHGDLRSLNIDYNTNGPLRGCKGSFFEGGIRIPFIVRWPGRSPAASVSDEVICHSDLMRSFATMLRAGLPEGSAPDSHDVLPAFAGESLPERSYVLQGRGGYHALVQGKWIYLDAPGSGDHDEKPLVATPGQLYDLLDDLGQNNNLYERHPERVASMRQELQAIRQQNENR